MSKLCIALLAGIIAVANAESLAERYQSTAQKLIAAALADEHSTARLEYLCDRIGNRIGRRAQSRAQNDADARRKRAQPAAKELCRFSCLIVISHIET